MEVRSTDSRENRSGAIASELETLGATVSPISPLFYPKQYARETYEKNKERRKSTMLILFKLRKPYNHYKSSHTPGPMQEIRDPLVSRNS